MSISKKILIISSCIFSFSCHARITVTGDANAATGKSFSFYVSQCVGADNTFYVGRSSVTDNASADSIRQYSLAGFRAGATAFSPLAPAKVILNGAENQSNPLIGQQISCLGIANGTPIAVCADTPANVYWIASGFGSTEVTMQSITNVKDAQGATNSAGSTTAGVIKVTGSKSVIFAAAKKSESTFGVAGSGIALLLSNKNGLTQLPAVWDDTGVKAVPFNAELADLVIGNPALMSGSVFDMYWDEYLQRLYIVTQITGGAAGTDGVVGVMMGYLENQAVTSDGQTTSYTKLRLAPVVDKTLFADNDTIVGALGADSVVTLYKVRVMHTTTGCSYLIVVGNANGSGPEVCVYALPLVDKRATLANSTAWFTDATHGVLADKSIQAGTNLKTFYDANSNIRVIRGRGFQQAPTTLGGLTVETDAAAKVGGGISVGTVNDISVYKDAVLISAEGTATTPSGIYHSQPLFDGDGAIKGWTPWKRIIAATDTTPIFKGIHYAPAQGKVFALQGGTNTTLDTLISTTWGTGSGDGVLGGTTSDASVGFNDLLTNAFSDCGGIQGLFDFPKDTVGFSTTDEQHVSLMIATGYKKVVIIKSGKDSGTLFIPQVGSFVGANNKTFTEGSIDTSPDADTVMITMTGGALDTLGTITSATVVKSTSYGTYLVLGGTGGLAVLRQFNRNGTTRRGLTSDLRNTFSPMNTSFRWEILGSFTNIKKLTYDHAAQNLYILTATCLYRLPFDSLFALSEFVTGSALATPASLGLSRYATFSDVVVSGDLALLGTSQGLYATGIGGVVTTATTTAEPLWRKIPLFEGPTSIIQVTPFSNTNFAYDIAKNAGGMVEVLAGSVSQNLASLYRFSISDATSGVSSTTIQAIPDHIISTVTGPYAHLGAYKNHYTTDGGLPLFSSNQYTQKTGALLALSSDVTFGVALMGKVAREPRIIPFDGTSATTANGFVYNSASGSLIFVTPTGLHMLE